MTLVLALLVGCLTTAAVWLLLSRNLVRTLFGLVLMSNVANLVIFAGGGLTLGAPALIEEGAVAPAGPVANALPQALVLTAIVIGFGLLTFAFALAQRAFAALGTVDVDAMRVAEPMPGEDVTSSNEAMPAEPARRVA